MTDADKASRAMRQVRDLSTYDLCLGTSNGGLVTVWAMVHRGGGPADHDDRRLSLYRIAEPEEDRVPATFQIAACLSGLVGAVLLDALAQPRIAAGWMVRSGAGVWLLSCQIVAVFGAFLALCGGVGTSVVLALAVLTVLVVASNAKHVMLGEPLVFSDLALISAVFRHPQFYLSAVPIWQRAAAVIGAAALLALIVWLSVADLAARGAGLMVMLAGLGSLAASLRRPRLRALARTPDNEADVRTLGLTPTLMLYWLRWRRTPAPPACQPSGRLPPQDAPELLVVIQCESFADPAELFGDTALTLPSLTAARDNAWQHGDLHVSGFGAYTMRTEYAMLFGREENALSFRRYDPFLTALDEASYALPARLGAGWRSVFLHPHDLRFYGRDTIMPAAGFAELVGENRFAPPAQGEGRYVTDAAVADEILEWVKALRQPALLYAVTIENHGPWASDAASPDADLVAGYLQLVRKSDAMLGRLIAGLAAREQPAMLVFFGDHRPSIPGATDPAGARHTPYVVLRFDAKGRLMRGDGRHIDLTPAGLHHVVLDIVLGAVI